MADIKVLKGLISDELYAQLDEALKENEAKLADLASGNYVDSNKFTTEKQKAEQFKVQLDEATKKIEEFKALNPEQLKTAAEEWKNKFETAQADFARQQQEEEYSRNLKEAVKSEELKLKNPELFLSTIKDKKIPYNDGKFTGLKEEAEAFLKLYPDQTAGKTPAEMVVDGGGTPPSTPEFDSKLRAAMGLPTA